MFVHIKMCEVRFDARAKEDVHFTGVNENEIVVIGDSIYILAIEMHGVKKLKIEELNC